MNSQINEFKVLQHFFKMKKQGLKFFKRNNTPLKRGHKTLSGLYAIQHFKFMNWRISGFVF